MIDYEAYIKDLAYHFYIENCKKLNQPILKDKTKILNNLSSSFIWSETSLGHTFWQIVDYNIKHNNPITVFIDEYKIIYHWKKIFNYIDINTL